MIDCDTAQFYVPHVVPTPSPCYTIPPPPFPTLFPYTTLFRSPARRVTEPGRRDGPAPPGDAGAILRSAPRGRCRRDRKSTRLNSSHLGISYAVFCLKKTKLLWVV